MSIPERLRELIGREHDLDTVSWELKRYAQDLRAPVVGAYQISCSDESERECVESFHHIFVRELLPQLKYWSRSSFRTATLGGRYETGAIAIAEEHFATSPSQKGTTSRADRHTRTMGTRVPTKSPQKVNHQKTRRRHPKNTRMPASTVPQKTVFLAKPHQGFAAYTSSIVPSPPNFSAVIRSPSGIS